MRKIALILILSVILSTTVRSQEMARQVFKHEIGLAAGVSTGYGISYRYWPGKFGFQITTTPHIDQEYSTASFGVTGLMTLSEIDWMRVFLYVGNHFLYTKDHLYQYYDQNGNPLADPSLEVTREGRYILGIGPGFEFLLGKKFGFNLMFGFRSDWAVDDYKISITGETGIFYRL